MGFVTREQMWGHHEFHNDQGPPGALPFAFRVEWGASRLRSWLDPRHPRFLRADLSGEVRAEGLCGWTPCEGTLHIDYTGARRIRYDFAFQTDTGRFRYIGDKKNIRLWNLAVSHTTCFGVITDGTGQLVSTSVSLFRLRDLPRFVTAVRLRR